MQSYYPAVPLRVQAPPDLQREGRQLSKSLEESGVESWVRGNGFEREGDLSRALMEYSKATAALEDAKIALGNFRVSPDTYLGLARCRLDVARVLALQNRPQEIGPQLADARQNLDRLDWLIHNAVHPHGSPGWSWQVYYLSGEIDLLQRNVVGARKAFETASALNPSFSPASAMAQYLSAQPTATTQRPTPAGREMPTQEKQLVENRRQVVSDYQSDTTTASLERTLNKVTPAIVFGAGAVAIDALAFLLEIDLAPLAIAAGLAGILLDLSSTK